MVAIIAVLVAMLLPALTHAKGIARIAVCQSNLRQIGLALNHYANDNNGAMLPSDKNMLPHDRVWPGYESPSWGGYPWDNTWDDWLRFYYMGGPCGAWDYPPGQVTTCPEIEKDMSPSFIYAGYGMNGMCPSGTVIYPWCSDDMRKWLSCRRLDDIKTNPSDSIYIADSSSGLSPYPGYHLNVIWKTPWGGDGSWLSAPARRHVGGDQGSFNILFFDFHVENAKWPYEDHGPHRLWNIWQYQTWNPFYAD